jgi:hypothetical protein
MAGRRCNVQSTNQRNCVRQNTFVGLGFNERQRPDDWEHFRVESLLGASRTGEKKYTEAEPLLLEGYQGIRSQLTT